MNSTINNEVKTMLTKLAAAEDIYDFKVETANSSVKGDGFIGDIDSLQIIGTDKEGENQKLDLVMKKAKKGDNVKQKFFVSQVFQLEIQTYQKVLSAYNRMEEEKGLSPTRLAPKFYGACMNNGNELIILENLKELGYKMCKKEIPLDEDHVNFVVRHYGKFHALSLALRDEHPEKFEEIQKFLFERWASILSVDPNMFGELYTYKCKKTFNLLDPVVDKEALRLCASFSNKIEDLVKSIFCCNDDPYSVILHGDCWTNNYMFKYNENSSKPSAVEFLDFQVSRLGSPVIDLVHFLYSSTSKKVIDNSEHYIRLYYDSLVNHLHSLGKDPEKLYPLEVFKEHLKKYARFGLIMSATLIHIMLSKPDEFTDITEVFDEGTEWGYIFDYKISEQNTYDERLKHILLHFAKSGFLDD